MTGLAHAARAVLLLAGVLCVQVAATTAATLAEYRARDALWLAAARAGAVALGAAAGAVALRRWRAARGRFLVEVATALPLRLAALCFAIAFLATSAAWEAGLLGDGRFLAARCLEGALLAALAAWTLWLATRPGDAARPLGGVAGFFDTAATVLLAGLVLLELALAAGERLGVRSPLLAAASASRNIERWRLAPGKVWYGTPANRGGYVDDDFFAAGERDLVVALISDSFGVGVVPRSELVSQLLEDALQRELGDRFERVAVHNFSVVAVGMREYRWLLEHEVLALRPELVVLCIFVGNDVLDPQRLPPPETLQGWRLGAAAHELRIALRARRADTAAVTQLGRGLTPAGDRPDPEHPTFDEETYFEIERTRARVADPRDPKVARRYAELFAELDAIHAALGDTLLVALIPDEFQVNDALWSTVAAELDVPLERDLPQRRIAAHCRARDIACVDLLGPLRAAEADGSTYHLRDTHWNARGNRVAAAALAPRVLAALAARPTAPPPE